MDLLDLITSAREVPLWFWLLLLGIGFLIAGFSLSALAAVLIGGVLCVASGILALRAAS